MITKEQFAELERLARAASPGPWEYQTSNGWLRVGTTPANRGRMDGDIVANDAASPANMAYIAAANPATVLALLDRIAEQEQDAARYRWLLKKAWFQRAFERYDFDDGGSQRKFEACADKIIDEGIAREVVKQANR